MKKIKFFTNLLAGLSAKQNKVILGLEPKLQELEKSMKTIQAMDNNVEAIIRLFQVIAPIHDARGFSPEVFELAKKNRRDKFDKEIKALQILDKHFINAGRSGGMNRTKKGEEVNAHKVYLGNVYGLFTKTAAYWLQNQEELKNDLRLEISKDPKNPASNWYLISEQSGNFVKSHTNGILEQIKILRDLT